MTITLRPEHEKLIAEAIQSGAYENAEQVIERALEILRQENDWHGEDRDEISEKIERAWQQSERGKAFTPEEYRAEMERRKAAWLAERNR